MVFANDWMQKLRFFIGRWGISIVNWVGGNETKISDIKLTRWVKRKN